MQKAWKCSPVRSITIFRRCKKKMKLLVLSDSHGKSEMLSDIIREHRDAEYIIFLGDGERDLELALAENGIDPFDPHARRKVLQVCGNCDLFSREPVTITEEIGGHRLMITHGFRENVKYGLSLLASDAASRNCDIALFGHTHRQHLSESGGVNLFNPGSVLGREYGVVTLENGECTFEFGSI